MTSTTNAHVVNQFDDVCPPFDHRLLPCWFIVRQSYLVGLIAVKSEQHGLTDG
jgi:hypothetical protein